MINGRALVLGSGMRIIYKGIIYYLVDMSARFEFDPINERLKITQTFFIIKQEPSTLEDMSTIIEVPGAEINPLMGNDFMDTSPYIKGIEQFLSGGYNNEPY